jgi:hypothetical protein
MTKPKRAYKKRQPVVIARSDVSNEPEPEPTTTEHVLETVPEPVLVVETQQPSAPSPKLKRERTEKQILAFKKMQEKRKEQDELKKLNKTIEKDKQIHDNHSTKIQKLKDKIISNASSVIPDDEEPEELIRSGAIPRTISDKPKPVARKPRVKKTIIEDQEEHDPPPQIRRQVSNDVKYIFV